MTRVHYCTLVRRRDLGHRRVCESDRPGPLAEEPNPNSPSYGSSPKHVTGGPICLLWAPAGSGRMFLQQAGAIKFRLSCMLSHFFDSSVVSTKGGHLDTNSAHFEELKFFPDSIKVICQIICYCNLSNSSTFGLSGFELKLHMEKCTSTPMQDVGDSSFQACWVQL